MCRIPDNSKSIISLICLFVCFSKQNNYNLSLWSSSDCIPHLTLHIGPKETHLQSYNNTTFPTVPNNEAIFSFTISIGIWFNTAVANIWPCMKLFSTWCECASTIPCIVWMLFEIKSNSSVRVWPFLYLCGMIWSPTKVFLEYGREINVHLI